MLSDNDPSIKTFGEIKQGEFFFQPGYPDVIYMKIYGDDINCVAVKSEHDTIQVGDLFTLQDSYTMKVIAVEIKKVE